MDNEKNTAKQKKLKKKRILALVITLGVILVLVLLNTLDFSSTPVTEDTTTVYTPDTYAPESFIEPDYDSDILKDPQYLALNRQILYSFNQQELPIHSEYSPDNPFTDFFIAYFAALQSGFAGSDDTAEGFNAFYSEVYFRDHAPFAAFAPQKVYDISVIRKGEVTINAAESEEDQAYLGATLVYFEVRYKILRNDGTFRQDILDDEMIPLQIDILYEKNGDVSINRVTYTRHASGNTADEEEKDGSILPFLMPILWLVVAVIALLLFVILRKKLLVIPALSAFVAFLVSVKGAIWVQFTVFIPLTVLLAVALLWWQRKKASASDGHGRDSEGDSPDTDPAESEIDSDSSTES